MLIALLIAGIGFLLAGLLGVAFGIPVKEFSFGNTEILAGVITACTGAIMLGLWLVIRELRAIAQELAFGAAVTPRMVLPQLEAGPAPHDEAAENDGLLFNQPGAAHPAEVEPAEHPSAPATPPPWHEQTAARDRVRGDPPPALPVSIAEAAPAAKQKRNLLFSSTSRKERERAEAPAPAKAAEPSATFEEAWPPLERARPPEAPLRRSGRTPPAVAEASAGAAADRPTDRPADRPPPAVRDEDPPAVTMLKSGVVDGMAYSLYSDGSIEAQMPEGMMRFGSIDELRAYLDQRG
ncbi:DUF308 domain-containing protein [Bradyrhizobium sp. S69]|uniref:DUF308 domain-containing protein n=1 Tax=Bradyrhizobium sp. S69 TaxID=1641856 RepID=UPI00131ADBE1|nr:DUF308 domain-containing protein [Bradyrhizobium sp. S69]